MEGKKRRRGYRESEGGDATVSVSVGAALAYDLTPRKRSASVGGGHGAREEAGVRTGGERLLKRASMVLRRRLGGVGGDGGREIGVGQAMASSDEPVRWRGNPMAAGMHDVEQENGAGDGQGNMERLLGEEGDWVLERSLPKEVFLPTLLRAYDNVHARYARTKARKLEVEAQFEEQHRSHERFQQVADGYIHDLCTENQELRKRLEAAQKRADWLEALHLKSQNDEIRAQERSKEGTPKSFDAELAGSPNTGAQTPTANKLEETAQGEGHLHSGKETQLKTGEVSEGPMVNSENHETSDKLAPGDDAIQVEKRVPSVQVRQLRIEELSESHMEVRAVQGTANKLAIEAEATQVEKQLPSEQVSQLRAEEVSESPMENDAAQGIANELATEDEAPRTLVQIPSDQVRELSLEVASECLIAFQEHVVNREDEELSRSDGEQLDTSPKTTVKQFATSRFPVALSAISPGDARCLDDEAPVKLDKGMRSCPGHPIHSCAHFSKAQSRLENDHRKEVAGLLSEIEMLQNLLGLFTDMSVVSDKTARAERDTPVLIFKHQLTGFKFRLELLGDLQLAYQNLSLGTLIRVAPWWMKDDIDFTSDYLVVFMNKFHETVTGRRS